jgi:homoaconitase/3-isopropylmalate dehydratase large subunit
MNSNYRKPLHGTVLHYFDARAAVEEIQPGAWDKLPYTSRVLAENLVRRCDPVALVPSLKQLIERKRELDFPWFPARVVCHDILGQTALVDLAGLRDAIASQGGDPRLVNPVVPTQLVVDHSLAVECGGFDPDAFARTAPSRTAATKTASTSSNWTRKAFQNVDVIPPGNGILHQINLERMSPVVQVKDGVAFPDTLVGTDSHTPMVDALGVIAIGVGGLEAESVMLGRASYMRLPDIVGVELRGKPQPGITATDIVLALTEFLRKSKVVSAYLEFYGEGAAKLTLGDRATISNMAPEYGATAAMFAIDEQTIKYLKLTGRDDELVKLVELYAKETGLWADTLANVEYERVLSFDLSTVVRNIAGPSNPHKRVPTSELAQQGIAGVVENEPGLMPDGAVIIAAITSCTNTNNPRNMVAAGLLAKKANEKGLLRKPWVKSSLAPGSKAVALYMEEAGLLPSWKAGLRHRGLRLHHLQRHVGRARPGDPEGRSSNATCTRPPSCRATAISTAASTRMPSRPSWPRRRWWWRTRSPARSASTSRRTCWARTRTARRCAWPTSGRATPRSTPWSNFRQAAAVPQGLRHHVRAPRRRRRSRVAAVRLARDEHLHPPSAVLGRRAGRRAHAERHAGAGGPGRQHHHRPPVAVERDHAGQRGRRIPGTRWACRKRTSIPTRPTAATT